MLAQHRDIEEIVNILLTCVGRRNYLAKYFSEACGERGRVVGVDRDMTAPALADCDTVCEVPSIDSPNYIDKILGICQQYDINMLVSLNDLELPIIARNKGKFEAIDVTPIVSDEAFIDMCFDKYASFQWLVENGFDTPYTVLDLDDAKEAIDASRLKFPLIVKPRWGSASTCVFRVNSVEEMELAYGLTQHQLTRNLLKSVSNVDKRNIVIQQLLTGAEHGVDVLNDLAGQNQQVLVKQKIAMRAGETDKACLVRSPILEKLGAEIGAKTAHIGNLDCDVFMVEGKAYVLELNPRFGGGYPFSHLAGADFPRAIVEWVRGNKNIPTTRELEYDVVYAKSENLSRMDNVVSQSDNGLTLKKKNTA